MPSGYFFILFFKKVCSAISNGSNILSGFGSVLSFLICCALLTRGIFVLYICTVIRRY